MWEDQGTNITETILNMNKHLGDAKNNTDNLKNTVAQIDESPAVKLQQAFQDLKTASEPLLSVIADVVSKIAEWVSNNPTLAATITAVASAIGIIMGAMMALAPIITAITMAAGAMGVSIGAIAGPIAIAVAAIAGIIAIGVLLYKNWDTIKAKAKELWNDLTKKWENIKSSIATKAQQIWQDLTKKWENIKSSIATKAQQIWQNVTQKWQDIKTSVSNKVEELKNNAITKFQNIVNAARDKFNEIKNKIMSPIEKAKNFVKDQVDKIKGFFDNLKLKLPKIKLPHFKLSGSFSLNPPRVPKISVDWYKTGGVFENPVIFGNAGFGDVSEAIVPFEGRHARKIAGLIAREMPQQQPTINVTLNYTGNNINDAYRMIDIIERELGSRMNTRLRMNGVK